MIVKKATQWFNMGDVEDVVASGHVGHPHDLKKCGVCNELHAFHGWLLGTGPIVCPGNYVLTLQDGSLRVVDASAYQIAKRNGYAP